MIRKVPNMSAWIMRAKDHSKWASVSKIHLGFQTIRELPLFDTNPIATMYWTIEENELILVIDSYVHSIPYTLEEIEEINKTWDKFYES